MKTPTNNCDSTIHNVIHGQSYYWIAFETTNQQIELESFLVSGDNLSASVELYAGDCTGAQLLENLSNYSVGTSAVVYSNLSVGSTYYFKMSF